MVVACGNCIYGGAEGVSMSLCAGCWLLQVLGSLYLLEGAVASECSSYSTCCMMPTRFVAVESVDCCATVGFYKFALVLLLSVES